MFRTSAKALSGIVLSGLLLSSSIQSIHAQTQQRTPGNQNTASYAAQGSGSTSVELASYGENYPGTSDGFYSSYNTPKPMGYGPMWPATGNRDCSRFYHYPYVYYPQNFRSSEYYRSSDSMYYRYPPEMQIPVYNKHWQNYYPNPRRYHSGHHFITDVF